MSSGLAKLPNMPRWLSIYLSALGSLRSQEPSLRNSHAQSFLHPPSTSGTTLLDHPSTDTFMEYKLSLGISLISTPQMSFARLSTAPVQSLLPWVMQHFVAMQDLPISSCDNSLPAAKGLPDDARLQCTVHGMKRHSL